jgi:hypothetical protein
MVRSLASTYELAIKLNPLITANREVAPPGVPGERRQRHPLHPDRRRRSLPGRRPAPAPAAPRTAPAVARRSLKRYTTAPFSLASMSPW